MKYWCKFDGEEREFSFARHGDKLICTSGDRSFDLDLSLIGDGAMFSMIVDGRSYDVLADVQREQVALQIVGERFLVQVEDDRERAAHAAAGNKASGRRELRAAMPGVVVAVKAKEGDVVAEGQTLVVLEAMKMQNPLAAESGGKVTRVLCKAGEAVAGGALLMELE